MMQSTRLACMGGMLLSLSGLVLGQTQATAGSDPISDTLHFKEIWQPAEKTLLTLELFYLDAERRSDLDKAIPELITALDQKGYHFRSDAGKKTYHCRTEIHSGPCSEERHLASEDGTFTIDVIVYPDDETARGNYRKQAKGGPSYGSNDPYRIVQLLLPNKPGSNSELTAKVYANGVLLNLNWILPLHLTWEHLKFEDYPNGQGAPQWMLKTLPGKKFSMSNADYQKTLHELKPKTDSFREVAYLAIEQLVVPEDRISMPKASEPSLTTSQRIANFIYLWSEVKYNFANFDLVPRLNWDRVKDRYLPLVEKAQSDEEYFRLMSKLLAELHDGHTSLQGGDAGVYPPVRISPVEGKAVITELSDRASLEGTGLKPGMEITHVDGRTVSDIIEKDQYPYICASTPQSRDIQAYSRLLTGPNGSNVKITVRDLSGKVREATLTRLGGRTNKPPFEYRSLPGDIAYVALGSFGAQDVVDNFDRIFDDKIRKAKGLIIDVRENNGGSTGIGYDIIGRLIDKTLKGSVAKTRQYLPAFRALGREANNWYELGENEVVPRGANPYLGPVVVLTSPRTVSAAEDFLIPLKAGKRATLVGERTAGSTGMPVLVNVGGGVQARICTKRDTYPDGSDFVGVGVIPDVEVHPTQKDIADGKDRILEEGIAVLSKKIAQNEKR